MKPWSEDEAALCLLAHGSVITLLRWNNGKVERFILEPEEVTIKELQDDKPELRR